MTIFVVFLPSFCQAQGAFDSKGCTIHIGGGSYLHFTNMVLINNNSGNVFVKESSQIVSDSDIQNNSGNVQINDLSFIQTASNFFNSDSLNILDNARLSISKDLVNSGHILNEKLIEIGECP